MITDKNGKEVQIGDFVSTGRKVNGKYIGWTVTDGFKTRERTEAPIKPNASFWNHIEVVNQIA